MNLRLSNAINFLHEIFWEFYFLPIMATLGVTIIIIVFRDDCYYIIPLVGVGSFCAYNFLFFWKLKRKKHYHGEDY